MFGVDRDQMVLPAKPSNVMELLDLWPPPPSSKAVIISVSIDPRNSSRYVFDGMRIMHYQSHDAQSCPLSPSPDG
jgi:hypothetical protein